MGESLIRNTTAFFFCSIRLNIYKEISASRFVNCLDALHIFMQICKSKPKGSHPLYSEGISMFILEKAVQNIRISSRGFSIK